MATILDITKGKNKLILSGIVGVLGALILLTAIHIAAKIAVIVSAAVVTYSVLSLIHWINNNKSEYKKTKEIDVTDDGYCSAEEDKKVLSVEDPKKTEAEIEEELITEREQKKTEAEVEKKLIIEREQKRMENGSLGGPINTFGEPINSKPDNEITAQNDASDESIVMKSLPKHMDVHNNPLPNEITTTAKNSCSIDYEKSMVVPKRIVLEYNEQSTNQKDPSQTQCTKDYMSLMESFHEQMNNLFPSTLADTSNVRKEPLLSPDELESHQNADIPNTYINTDSSSNEQNVKLSPAEWLSRYGGITSIK